MIAFIKKEMLENIRTHKALILIIVFVLFGFMSPLFAKLTPEILKLSGLDGEALGLGEPTALDSWTQFFKNVGQMGFIVLVIVYSGIISHEFIKGTLVNILTKGIKRSNIILAKFLVSSLVWTVAYFICFGITYLYTMYFFDITIISNLCLSIISLWIFGVFLISLTILGGILTKNTYGSLLLPAIVTAILGVVNIIPKVEKFNPIALSSYNMSLLTKSVDNDIIYGATIVTVMAIIVSMIVSIMVFNKQEI